MSRREFLGFAAVACAACCIGPILGVLGAIATLGAVSVVFLGVVGLGMAAAATVAFVIVRRRPTRSCEASPDPVAVELTRTAP